MTETTAIRWQQELAKHIEGDVAPYHRCGLVINPATTDIIQDAHERSIPAVLIEFSEGLCLPDLDCIATRIADFLCYVANHKSIVPNEICRDTELVGSDYWE
jgi:hypothetical protein